MAMSDPSNFTIGGVNGTTGRYLLEPGIDARQVMALALAESQPRPESLVLRIDWLEMRWGPRRG
jgi:hypothetical protein